MRRCGGGAPGTVLRFGFSCTSHGASALSGGRDRGLGGLEPLIGSERVAQTPGRNCTRLVPPVASTRNHWPLPSPERLSPARPGSGFGVSSKIGPTAGKFGSSIVSWDQGRMTSLTHEEL